MGERSLKKLVARAISTIFAAVILASCGLKPPRAPQHATESGIASWYGMPFDGRRTASGEIFDMEKRTAAHRTIPFGAVVRVEYLRNHKTVDVRINDRGPFIAGRIIDLSHNAAQSIGLQSIGYVRLEILEQPRRRAADTYAVQVGAFSDQASAALSRDGLERRFGTAQLVFREGDEIWRVLVGVEPSIEAAERLAAQLQIEPGGAFVVRIDSPE